MNDKSSFTRREVLKMGALTGAGAALGTLWPFRAASAATRKGPRFRFIHYTDIHVQPELAGARGYAQAIAHMNGQKADFAISGGDLVFDSLKTARDRCERLWKLYTSLGNDFDMPVYQTLGNHDNLGLSNPDIASTDPDYGKKAFLTRFQQNHTYRSFDHKGWHFVILDSILPQPGGWKPVLDEEQMAWLKSDLAANKLPVIATLHVPIFTFISQIAHGPTTAPGEHTAMNDGKALRELFEASNVKLVLQGHVHIREHFEYNGINYITSGAVCGSWWNGPRMGHPEGYATIDIDGDGFDWQYHTFGWKAVKA